MVVATVANSWMEMLFIAMGWALEWEHIDSSVKDWRDSISCTTTVLL